MKLKLAFIQAEGGIPASDTFFRAWEGFRKRRVPCELFEPQQLRNGSLPLSRDTLVAGGVPVVEDALKALGISVPPADNLPACLASISTLPNSVNKRDVWGQEKRMARRLPPNQGIGVGSSASCEATRYGLCARLSSRTTTSSSNTSTVADTSSRLRNSFFAVAC